MSDLMSNVPPRICSRSIHFAFFALVLLSLVFQIVSIACRPTPFGKLADPTTGRIKELLDFPAHLNFARQVWTGRWRGAPQNATGYSPAGHREVLDDWIGTKELGLPFGYSPTMIWVLGPFVIFEDSQAYVLWSLVQLIIVLWFIYPDWDPSLLGLMCFGSILAVDCIVQGQTGILTTVALIILFRSQSEVNWWSFFSAIFALWALTAKPPLALLGGAVMLMSKRWEVVVASIFTTILTTALIHPLLGPGWISDYLALISHYNSEQADPLFVWCLAPTYMTNLRSILFAAGVSDALASQVCWVLWLFGLSATVLLGWVGRLKLEAGWILAILVTVTFSPHVNQTEDLHLYLAALLSWPLVRNSSSPLIRSTPYLFAGLVFLVALRMRLPFLLLPFFALKLALVIEIPLVGFRRGTEAVPVQSVTA